MRIWGRWYCLLIGQSVECKVGLVQVFGCRWICKTYTGYCYRNSATVRRLVQSPTLQSTIFCGVHSDLRGKGIRVSPACRYAQKLYIVSTGNVGCYYWNIVTICWNKKGKNVWKKWACCNMHLTCRRVIKRSLKAWKKSLWVYLFCCCK